MKPPTTKNVSKVNVPKEIKAIARERVGAVKPGPASELYTNALVDQALR